MKSKILLVTVISLILFSCSETSFEGAVEANSVDAKLLLSANSEIVQLVSRVVGSSQDPVEKIECINFIYTVNLLVYDENLLITNQFSVKSNEEFLTVLKSLNSTESISISYPIFGVLSDGAELKINSNEELKQSIMSCAKEELIEVIIGQIEEKKCIYFVPFIENEDNTYASAFIDFNEDRTINFHHQGETLKGTINVLIFGVESSININLQGDSQIAADWNMNFDFIFIENGIKLIAPDKSYTLKELCKSSQEFAVGQTGPAGGIVAYMKEDFSDGWQYMEVLETDLPLEGWGCDDVSMEAKDRVGLGFGWSNTALIVNKNIQFQTPDGSFLCGSSNLSSIAPLTALLHDSNNWFIPSIDELQLIYDQLGGEYISPSIFWSSNENSISNTFVFDFSTGLKSKTLKGSRDVKTLLVRYF